MRRAWGLIGALVLLVGGLYVASRWLEAGPGAAAPGTERSTRERPPARRPQVSSSPSGELEAERLEEDSEAPPGEAREAPGPTETGLPCSLAGRVADEEGRPVPGALVQVLRDDGEVTPPVPTDAQGEYQFPELLSGDFTLVVTSDAYVEQQLSVPLVPGANLFDFTLRRAVLVSGVVVNEAGQPVADVSVALDERLPTQEETTQDVTSSGEDGTFRLKALQAGAYRVRLQHSDYLPTEQPVSAPAERLRLVLRSGMNIEAEVVDEAGQPSRQAVVFARGEPPEGEVSPVDTTDEAGKVTLKGLKPGKYRVMALVHAKGHLRTVSGSVEAHGPGLVHVRMQLKLGLRVSGTVVDRAGKPVVGAEVRLAPLFLSEDNSQNEHAGDPSLEFLQDAWTGGSGEPLETEAEGRFSASGLEAGTYLVTALKQGYVFKGPVDEIESVPGVRASAGGAEVRLVMDFMGLVRGRVVDEDGAPIPSFQVEDESFGSEQGVFQKAIEEPGEVEWLFLAEGMTGSRRKVRVREGEVVDLGNVVLRRGRQVRVQVLDARTSQPVQGVEVDVLGTSPGRGEEDSRLDLISALPPAGVGEAEGLGGRDFSTSAAGVVVLRNMEEQSLRLELTHPDYETESVPLGPRQAEVVVRLRPAPPAQAEPLP